MRVDYNLVRDICNIKLQLFLAFRLCYIFYDACVIDLLLLISISPDGYKKLTSW